jgi:hypothetical protein
MAILTTEETLFNHLVLPPLLIPTIPKAGEPAAQIYHPDSIEEDTRQLNSNLVKYLGDACVFLRNTGSATLWDTLNVTLRETHHLNQDYVQKDTLLKSLNRVRRAEADRSWIAIHISAQNAAILVHKDST